MIVPRDSMTSEAPCEDRPLGKGLWPSDPDLEDEGTLWFMGEVAIGGLPVDFVEADLDVLALASRSAGFSCIPL